MALKMRALTPLTGSEITGIDLREPVDAETRRALRHAFAERAVLCFRNQPLTPAQFLEAGRIFGDIMPQQVARFTLPEDPLVGFVSSDDTDKPGGTRLVRGEQFHTDHSNFAAPPLATCLKAVHLPSKGGDMRFVNMHAAYDDLPAATRARIDGLRALHVFKSSRSPRRKVELTEEERKKIPQTVQPLVLVHPVNGRKAVYLNTAHIERIIGMEDEAAFALVNDLMAHCTQAKYEYRHVWQPDDMVIWDNRSLMHSATADYAPTEKRYLYRLMVAGSPLQAAA